jgi:YVTN family beta-propeller protein
MKFGFPTGLLQILRGATFAWFILAGALTMAAHPIMAQRTEGKPSSGLINPRAIAFSPATGKVYAVDTSRGAVQIYNDALRQTSRVKVGAEPVSIAVNETNGRVYVANAGDGTVTVLDGNSDEVLATIPVGSHPYSIAANATTGKVYITHTFGDELSILDGGTNTVTSLKTGSHDLIAINARTDTIYLLGYEGGTVSVVDGVHQSVRIREAGKHAWGLTLNEATGTLYATRIETAEVAALAEGSQVAATLAAGAIPCAIAVNSKADLLYVANYGDNTVTVVDADTGNARATVRVGDHPKGIAFDPDRKLVYVANTSSDSVTVIDAEHNAVLATLPAGKSPYALAVVPGSSRLYVANEVDDNSSTAIDLSAIRKPTP